MTKGENGVWEVTLGPIDPGAYRYNFNVDRVSVIDPRNPSISESNNNVWSMVYIPGADFMDTKECRTVRYRRSPIIRRAEEVSRMHVYTPPGYEADRASIRCSICCMAPGTATNHGRQWGVPGSSWTT